MAGNLSPVMLIAAQGMVQNTALGVAADLVQALDLYQATVPVSQYQDILDLAQTRVDSTVLTTMRQLASNNFPALTAVIPTAAQAPLASIAPGGSWPGGMANLILTTAQGIMGRGDLSIFGQIFNEAQTYIQQSNDFVASAQAAADLNSTFGPLSGGMDGLTTGGVSLVTQDFPAFAQDLRDLGVAIDLDRLEDLGLPSALVQQLAQVAGLTPAVQAALIEIGFDDAAVASFSAGQALSLSDQANRDLYRIMTGIRGSDLESVLQILQVQTVGIDSMADLLDPQKIFPRSWPSLTMPTPNGVQPIYIDGVVDSNLAQYFVPPRRSLPVLNP